MHSGPVRPALDWYSPVGSPLPRGRTAPRRRGKDQGSPRSRQERGTEYQGANGEEELDIEIPVQEVTLPVLGEGERLSWEYELLGLAPGDHVMRLYRKSLRARGVLSSREITERQDGQPVRVAGLVVVRQRPPTAKGHVFITLEDEEGLVNLIIRPTVYERYKSTIRNAPVLLVEGCLQREGHAISVLVHRASAVSLLP